MDQRHRVHDALEDLTRAVNALGEVLREAGITAEEAVDEAEAPAEANSTDGVPFVPILVPMDVLRAWGAQARGVAGGNGSPSDSARELTPGTSPPAPPADSAVAAAAASRGPAPAPTEATPPKSGTWVWTWEHPTPEGERIEDEIEGGR